ncbi:MAG: 50S ribosomal protein L11 methyltransferase [Desulfonatronovibrio sp.]
MYSLTVKDSPENIEKIQPLLHQHINWGWEEKNQDTVIIHFSSENPAVNFKRLVRETIPDSSSRLQPVQSQDWTEDWKQYFTPINIEDTFIILPDWLEHTPSPLIKIIITPKMAFGTGHHATTSLCLKILCSLFRKKIITRDFRFLDLGTGSGILGIAGAKLGLKGTGLDIDPAATDNAWENIALNKVQDNFEVKTEDLHELDKNQKFNLIFANILAPTLQELAKEILSRLSPDRYCLILSGILGKQASDVAETYMSLGLNAPEATHEGEWCALVWNHSPG